MSHAPTNDALHADGGPFEPILFLLFSSIGIGYDSSFFFSSRDLHSHFLADLLHLVLSNHFLHFLWMMLSHLYVSALLCFSCLVSGSRLSLRVIPGLTIQLRILTYGQFIQFIFHLILIIFVIDWFLFVHPKG